MGGQGRDGRLGHGDQEHQLLPKKVEALAGQRVIAVSAGGEHSLTLTADGSVWSWGFGVEGQLGHGDMQNQLAGEKPGGTSLVSSGRMASGHPLRRLRCVPPVRQRDWLSRWRPQSSVRGDFALATARAVLTDIGRDCCCGWLL